MNRNEFSYEQPLTREEANQRGAAMRAALEYALQHLHEWHQGVYHEPHPILGIIIVGPFAKAMLEVHPSLYEGSELNYFLLGSHDDVDSWGLDFFTAAARMYEQVTKQRFPIRENLGSRTIPVERIREAAGAYQHVLKKYKGQFEIITI